MKSCSEVVNKDVLDAVTCSIRETNNARTAWLSSLTAVPDRLKEESVDVPTMPHHELIAAQQEDPAISVLWKLEGGRPIRKNSNSLPLPDSSYMLETKCSLLKIEFSIIDLDLET